MDKIVLIYNEFYKGKVYLENINLFFNGAKKAGLNIEKIPNSYVRNEIINGNISKPDFNYCLFLDKDIYLAKALEKCGVRLFNNSSAIEICDNKAFTHIALANEDINMPKTYIPPFTFSNIGYDNLDFLNSIKFPVVIKEFYGSFGQQVYIANSKDEISTKAPFLIQECLETKGSDVRAYVIGKKAVCAMERHNPNDFRANASQGGICTSFELTPEISDMAEKACKVLNLDFAGVDIIISKGTPYLIEVNSNAMVKHLVETTKIDVPCLVGEYIKTQLY